jgi:hypothetical protein
VPETAVNKNGNVLFAKDEIGFARQGQMAAPSRQAGLTQ